MQTKTLKILIPSLLAILLLAFFNPFSVNDAGNRQVIQTIGGDLDVRFEPGLYYSGFFSKVTTYPNNVTIQLGPEDKKSPESDYWSMAHTGTFAEGDQATLGHTVKWDLPTDDTNMKKIHTTYNNIDNLATTTLMQYQKETAIGVAKALAGPNGITFPSIVSGGNGANGNGALQTLELKMLNDLAKEMSRSKKN